MRQSTDAKESSELSPSWSDPCGHKDKEIVGLDSSVVLLVGRVDDNAVLMDVGRGVTDKGEEKG